MQSEIAFLVSHKKSTRILIPKNQITVRFSIFFPKINENGIINLEKKIKETNSSKSDLNWILTSSSTLIALFHVKN